MQPFDGTDPFTPNATPAGYGLWPKPLVMVADVLSSANLMAAAQAAINRLNFVAHRVYDIVSGGEYEFTAAISTKNTFNFRKTVRFQTGYGGQVRSEVPFWVQSGSTVHVGVDGSSTGHIDVETGSDITAKPGGVVKADGGGAALKAVNGGDIQADTAATVQLYGYNIIGNASGDGYATRTQPLYRVGDKAYEELRGDTLPKDGSDVNVSENDVLLVPTGVPSGGGCNFVVPSGAGYFEFSVIQTNPATQTNDFTCNVGLFKAAAVSSSFAGCRVAHLGSGVFRLVGKHDGIGQFNPATPLLVPYC